MWSEGAKRAGAVLIVEDEPLVRAVAADVFMDFGYRVFEACDVADALTILEGRDDIAAVFTLVSYRGVGHIWTGSPRLPSEAIDKMKALMVADRHE